MRLFLILFFGFLQMELYCQVNDQKNFFESATQVNQSGSDFPTFEFAINETNDFSSDEAQEYAMLETSLISSNKIVDLKHPLIFKNHKNNHTPHSLSNRKESEQATKANHENASENTAYSFFVAGHAYGKPGQQEKGIYPPFVKKFEQINETEHLRFGVLTGDIVQTGAVQEWKKVNEDLKGIDKDVHFALGNHDYKNIDYVHENFKETYYSFLINQDLHIVLDPNLDQWNISGKQLDFLKNLLASQANNVENIFVYFHQVLWWKQDSRYSKIKLNSHENRDPNINFWSEVAPLFSKLENPVYMFAGDIGAAAWSGDYSYHEHLNMVLISSGMGEGIGDNYLMVDVLTNNEVIIQLLPIQEGAALILE